MEARSRAQGFSLVEVMVSLIVISVGLLGIAKIQALAYVSTSTAGLRSLAAIEAASLASAMRADRAFWSQGLPAPVTVTGTTIAGNVGLATNTTSCLSPAPFCVPATLAAFDMQRWVVALNAMLPNPTATLTCPNITIPVHCTISVSWSERSVAVNAQATAGVMVGPQYTLYVDP
jgi:type IV pilus assembly protein PilV